MRMRVAAVCTGMCMCCGPSTTRFIKWLVLVLVMVRVVIHSTAEVRSLSVQVADHCGADTFHPTAAATTAATTCTAMCGATGAAITTATNKAQRLSYRSYS